jgi:hypothetical protein
LRGNKVYLNFVGYVGDGNIELRDDFFGETEGILTLVLDP